MLENNSLINSLISTNANLGTKEIFSKLELITTNLKRDTYDCIALVRKLTLDPKLALALEEHLNKIYQEFDGFQTFCKSRTS